MHHCEATMTQTEMLALPHTQSLARNCVACDIYPRHYNMARQDIYTIMCSVQIYPCTVVIQGRGWIAILIKVENHATSPVDATKG